MTGALGDGEAAIVGEGSTEVVGDGSDVADGSTDGMAEGPAAVDVSVPVDGSAPAAYAAAPVPMAASRAKPPTQ